MLALFWKTLIQPYRQLMDKHHAGCNLLAATLIFADPIPPLPELTVYRDLDNGLNAAILQS